MSEIQIWLPRKWTRKIDAFFVVILISQLLLTEVLFSSSTEQSKCGSTLLLSGSLFWSSSRFSWLFSSQLSLELQVCRH